MKNEAEDHMGGQEGINFQIEASAEQIGHGVLAALRVGAWAHYNAMDIGFAVGQKATADTLKKPPADLRREWMKSAYQTAINLLPQGNPFREALAKVSAIEVAAIKD